MDKNQQQIESYIQLKYRDLNKQINLTDNNACNNIISQEFNNNQQNFDFSKKLQQTQTDEHFMCSQFTQTQQIIYDDFDQQYPEQLQYKQDFIQQLPQFEFNNSFIMDQLYQQNDDGNQTKSVLIKTFEINSKSQANQDRALSKVFNFNNESYLIRIYSDSLELYNITNQIQSIYNSQTQIMNPILLDITNINDMIYIVICTINGLVFLVQLNVQNINQIEQIIYQSKQDSTFVNDISGVQFLNRENYINQNFEFYTDKILDDEIQFIAYDVQGIVKFFILNKQLYCQKSINLKKFVSQIQFGFENESSILSILFGTIEGQVYKYIINKDKQVLNLIYDLQQPVNYIQTYQGKYYTCIFVSALCKMGILVQQDNQYYYIPIKVKLQLNEYITKFQIDNQMVYISTSMAQSKLEYTYTLQAHINCIQELQYIRTGTIGKNKLSTKTQVKPIIFAGDIYGNAAVYYISRYYRGKEQERVQVQFQREIDAQKWLKQQTK